MCSTEIAPTRPKREHRWRSWDATVCRGPSPQLACALPLSNGVFRTPNLASTSGPGLTASYPGHVMGALFYRGES